MNGPLNTSNGAGLLKKAYPGKGPISQMNAQHPMLTVLRQKRDALKNI